MSCFQRSNSLTINGEVYELQNARLYLLIGSDISAHLYNDKANNNGKSMGRWWLDSVSATNAYIFALNWDYDDMPDEEDFEEYYDQVETPDDGGDGEGGTGGDAEPNVLTGQTVRTLSRGFCIPTGKSQTVAKKL